MQWVDEYLDDTWSYVLEHWINSKTLSIWRSLPVAVWLPSPLYPYDGRPEAKMIVTSADTVRLVRRMAGHITIVQDIAGREFLDS